MKCQAYKYLMCESSREFTMEFLDTKQLHVSVIINTLQDAKANVQLSRC